MAVDLCEHIRRGDWDTVVSRFGPTMATTLDADGLADAWASVVAVGGEVEATGVPFVRLHGLHTIVDLPVEQEADEITMRIAYDDTGKIAGLFFLTRDIADRSR
ncbi:DUF3887 domain-containing protein [Gordonia sp. CPCC 206044]